VDQAGKHNPSPFPGRQPSWLPHVSVAPTLPFISIATPCAAIATLAAVAEDKVRLRREEEEGDPRDA